MNNKNYYLLLKDFRFTTDIDAGIAENLKIILMVGDSEFYGSEAFYSAYDLLFKREGVFLTGVADTLQDYIERYAFNLVTVKSVNITRVDSITFNIEIDAVSKKTGDEISLSINVCGI